MPDSPRSDERWGRQGEAAVRLIESLGSHAIFTLDAEGVITTWPAPASELYGHDAETVLGEHLRVLLGDRDGTIEDAATILPEAKTGTVEREGWHERSDGSVFWGTLTLSPLRKSEEYGAVCRDTTTTKEYQRMLERQNDRLKEFTDILAHDLRNPLNAIDQYLTLYEESGERTHIESIDQTTDRMARLVDDLLRVAKQGDVVTDPEPTDIETVEDDGPGISDSVGAEVFDHGVTTARDGSGYGLSIVRTIVNAHGWDISLATAESGGARFEITGIEFLD